MDFSNGKTGIMVGSRLANKKDLVRCGLNKTQAGGLVERIYSSSMWKNSAGG
jgi:hypothetical protein